MVSNRRKTFDDCAVFFTGKQSEAVSVSAYINRLTGLAFLNTMIWLEFSTARYPRLCNSLTKACRPIKRSISGDLRRMTGSSRATFELKMPKK